VPTIYPAIQAMHQKTERTLFIVLSVLFAVYIILRAWWLPITHDEGATCFNHVPRRLFDTLFFQKEANPNNHILNTLGIKIFQGIFGWSTLVIRLPALIGGFCYLGASMLMARRISQTGWVRVLILLLLLGNPFMLEFFALGRGYGLAIGFMSIAIWQSWLFADRNERKYASRAAIFAGLAVYANFTLLIFYAPFLGLLWLTAWMQNRTLPGFWAVSGGALKATGLFIALMATPLSRLSKDTEIVIWNRLPSFFTTVEQLVSSAIRNKPYLGENTVKILSILLIGGVVMGWLIAAIRWLYYRRKYSENIGILSAALLAGVVLTNFVQVWVTHTPFLQSRLSLFYYPLAALLLGSTVEWVHARFGRGALLYAVPLAFLLLLNSVRCLNFHNSVEWWYDSATLRVLDYLTQIHEKEKPAEPYKLNVHWAAQNSFGVHTDLISPEYKSSISLAPWHNNQPPERDGNFEFYYAISPDEAKDIIDIYDIVYRVPESSFLLLRKRK